MTLAKTTKYEQLGLSELKALVNAAKNYDPIATERLCNQFSKLIYKEANDSFIRDKLGDDAINDSWEAFLESVHSYDGNGISRFPLYAKKCIRGTLYNKINRELNKEISLSYNLKDEMNIMDMIPDPEDKLSIVESKVEIDNLLSILTPKQKHAVLNVIIRGERLTDVSKKTNVDKNTIKKLIDRSLVKLKKYIEANNLY